jgi:hypothetical protein
MNGSNEGGMKADYDKPDKAKTEYRKLASMWGPGIIPNLYCSNGLWRVKVNWKAFKLKGC